MTSAIAKTGINWAEYYRLRNRARWSLPAFLAAAYVLPIPLGIGLRNLRPAFQEVQRAGHDEADARRRDFHWPRATEYDGPHEGRLRQGRKDHRARHVRARQQRTL